MKYKIWNKKDKINNVDAEYIINTYNVKKEDEIFLILDSITNRVSEIQFKDIISTNYGIDISLSCEEVAQEYIRIKEEEKQQAENHMNTLEDMGNKISILEQNNQELREELTQIQTSIASLTSLIATTLEEK